MKFLDIALVTLLAQPVLITALELNISNISKCTLSCLLETFPAANCTLTDNTCQCHNQALVLSTSNCMLKNCPVADSLALGRLRDQICDGPLQSRRRPLLIVNLAAAVLSLLTVSLRFLSRYLVCKKFWVDDQIIFVAMFLNIPFTILASWMILNGLGKHTWDIPTSTIPKIFQLFWVDESFYLVILLLTKVAILIFYLRIFPRRRFQICAKLILVFVVLSGVVILLLQIFQCLPVAYNWDKSISGAKCLNVNALTYTHAGMTVTQDLLILVLPLPELACLQLEWNKKLGVILMFQVGAFACVTSMVRLRFLTQFGGTNSVDPTWDTVDATLWTAAEVNTGIICSCLPAVRALLKPLFPGLLKSTGKSKSFFGSFRIKPNAATITTSDPEIVVYNYSPTHHTKGKKVQIGEVYLDKPLPVTPPFQSPREWAEPRTRD